MKSIGGYLELQLSKGEEFYPSLLKLNTGRNAFEYILKQRQYRRVHVPYYTCEVMLEPLKRLGIPFQHYTIDEHMDPVLDFEVGPEECLLYTNYFGLKQETVIRLGNQFKNLIIDNSQAFFSTPVAGVDTFYSCRKFFGVPDGAYLQVNQSLKIKLERDVSFERFSHLIKSIDLGIEQGYGDFIANNVQLSNNPIKKMSFLSHKILAGVDYKACRYRRNSNFMYLHEFLESRNDYAFDVSQVNGPMIYPLLTSSLTLRNKLLDKRVYVASYWPNVLDWTTKMMYEYYLTSHLIALPIDHRYTHADMKQIVNILKMYYE